MKLVRWDDKKVEHNNMYQMAVNGFLHDRIL